jgi:tRNA pseudouridine55 synthase
LKHHGWRYYKLARSGISLEPKVRQVQVFATKLTEWSPPFLIIEVECGKGTYIRSLVHELGQALGCRACVVNLVRLSYGPFHINQALSLSEVETASNGGYLSQFLSPPDAILFSLSALMITEEQEFLIKNGCPLPLSNELPFSSGYRRVYANDGRFIAVLRFKTRTGLWHPIKTFPQ